MLEKRKPPLWNCGWFRNPKANHPHTHWDGAKNPCKSWDILPASTSYNRWISEPEPTPSESFFVSRKESFRLGETVDQKVGITWSDVGVEFKFPYKKLGQLFWRFLWLKKNISAKRVYCCYGDTDIHWMSLASFMVALEAKERSLQGRVAFVFGRDTEFSWNFGNPMMSQNSKMEIHLLLAGHLVFVGVSEFLFFSRCFRLSKGL